MIAVQSERNDEAADVAAERMLLWLAIGFVCGVCWRELAELIKAVL